MELSRRSVLGSSASALALGVAGCLSEPGDGGSSGDREGYAAFFALWDWTERIVGDEMVVTNPVDVGEMGHGWEEPADLQRNIAGSDVFVYLDTAEFSWAQNIASELADEDVDTVVIDAMDGLETQLLPIDRETEADREPADHDFVPDEVSIGGFDVYDSQTGAETAYWHDGHWHGELPEIPVGGRAAVEGVFEDDEGRVLPLGTDETFQFEARIVDGANEDVLETESEGDRVVFHGEEAGRTRLVFELVADGEVVWDTSADNMTADVVEELGDDAAPEFYDPHVWADPVLAQQMVETIADGLGEADPDNADLYADNAAAYVDRIEDVHEGFEQLAADADREVAVFAGHDSFQYVEERYDFELHTPVGISPDAAETESDISESISVVEEHGIDTILYDPFETPNPGEDVPRMVELLLENTDADEYAPITPAEGTMAEWNERGWGWVEQMEEVTIPSLRQALGAE